MNEEFMAYIEMIIFKMVEEGKLTLQKRVKESGEIYVSLNCILKNDEPEDNGEYLTFVANPEGKFGVKIGDVRNL
jgi:hypothetical protein